MSSHTHTHCMSWVIYLKFLSVRKFVLIEYLTLIYVFAYFCNVIWLFYQLIIHVCSEANFRKKYFSTNFSPVSDFQCEASRRTYSYIQTRAVLPYADLVVATGRLSDTSGWDYYRFKTCVSFSAIHTSLHFYHGMLCVFLVDFSQDFGILCTSLFIPWSSLCLLLFF
jgi:hypothetical protein